ncbi:MAG: TonB-dependent receptor plug domain-containing protein, partial [Salibacteraceae bacterium]
MRTFTLAIALVAFQFYGIAQQDSVVKMKVIDIVEIVPAENYTTQKFDSLELITFQYQSLDEFLASRSDVFIKDYGPGSLSTISFRGMGSSHTNVFWNGVSLNSNMNGTTDISLFSLNAIDQIDVHYGASSMIDGAGSLGGSIKLKQKEFFNNGQRLSVSQSVGSYSTYQTAFSGLVSNKKTYLKIAGNFLNSENNFQYRNPELEESPTETMKGAGFSVHNLSATGGWLVNKSNTLKINYLNQYGNRNLPKLNTQETAEESQKDLSHIGFVDWRNYNKWFVNEMKLGFKYAELDYRNKNINIESISRERTIFLQNRSKYILFNKIKGNTAIFYDHIEAYNEKYGESKRLNQLKVTNDFRVELSNKTSAGLVVQTIVSDINTLPFLPSINLGHKFFENLLQVSVNASYHGALPTMNDLYWGEGGNPNLKPESGYSSELNVKGKRILKAGLIEYRVSGYYSEIDNWILWSPDETGIWRVNNESHVTSFGTEFSLVAKKSLGYFNSGISLGYNFNNSLNESNKQLVYTPVHKTQGVLSCGYKGLQFNYNTQWVGKRFINSNNTSW